MCIVIDTNVMKCVFDSQNAQHSEFKDVKEWIFKGKGKIIYGGTTYLTENLKYCKLFSELKKIGKAVLINNHKVDEQEKVVSELIRHPDFDDPHLIALLQLSKCKVICSLDSRAYPFFRHNLFFTPASKKPKIYSGSRNKPLLCDSYFCDLCLPASITDNKQKKIIEILFGN